jgi:hypothetical protein
MVYPFSWASNASVTAPAHFWVAVQFEGYRIHRLRKNAIRREAGVSTPA